MCQSFPTLALVKVGATPPLCPPPRAGPACTLLFCLQARLPLHPGGDLTPRSIQEKQLNLVTAQPRGAQRGLGAWQSTSQGPQLLLAGRPWALAFPGPLCTGPWGPSCGRRKLVLAEQRGAEASGHSPPPSRDTGLPGLPLSAHPPKVPTRRGQGSTTQPDPGSEVPRRAGPPWLPREEGSRNPGLGLPVTASHPPRHNVLLTSPVLADSWAPS